jgi:hypothetical protein
LTPLQWGRGRACHEMQHLRLGMGMCTLCAAAQSVYVYRERQLSLPFGRALQFSPGSQDDIVSGALRTGDLVVFSRDCYLYGSCGALACGSRKCFGGDATYDHVGFIVLQHGEPFLFERTHSGVHLRRYAARVRCSRSKEIYVRPLQPPLTPPQVAAAREAIAGALAPEALEDHLAAGAALPPSAALRASLASPSAAAGALVEAAALAAAVPGAHSSVQAVLRVYCGALGCAEAPGRGDMATLGAAPTAQPKWEAKHTFGRPVWVRDLT